MAEKDWIARYFAPLASTGGRGLQDDAGTLTAGGDWQVVTVDALVEGVHFLRGESPANVARKLVRVNVSDLLAKGSCPQEALLTLGWPNDRTETQLAEFASALGDELRCWNTGLVGGDTVSSPTFFVSMTMIGGPAFEGGRPVWQDGAEIGDAILLSGVIGGCVGLQDALNGRSSQAADHFRAPKLPPLEAASLVSRFANASTDVSDGLLADLSSVLAGSDLGGQIDLDKIRLWRESNEQGEIFEQCTAGDDYQIVCTASPANADSLIKSEMFYQIGEVDAARGLKLRSGGQPVKLPETLGFEHG